MNFPRGLSCALVLLTAPWAHAVSFRAEASTAWAENIDRASAPADWRNAWRHEGSLALGRLQEWRDGLTTVSEIDVGFEHVPSFTKLDALSGGLGTQVRQKFGFGPYTPVATFDVRLRRREARLEEDKGFTATAALGLGKRLTESWRMAASADWAQHYARSHVFDTLHRRFFATVSWDVTPRLQLSHGAGRLWGSFTANASSALWAHALSGASGPEIASYYHSIPRKVTNAFGPGWVTYRPRGYVTFWWLELSPAIGRNTSVPLRYENRFSVSKVGVKYRQEIWSVQLLHRF